MVIFFNTGISYRIQKKKTNFQFFNVHAGIGLGVCFLNKGIAGYAFGEQSNQDNFFQFFSTLEVLGKLMPVIFASFSKDIKITGKLALNLLYRHQLGFNNVFKTTK